MDGKDKGYLRINELEKFLNMGRSTIWARSKDDSDPFPKSIKLSPRVTVWSVEEITQFIDDLSSGNKG